MYGYGNSGNSWGIVIGIIIGAIIIFIICRELICWYYKINRLVELMEQQNSLLSSLMSKIDSSSNVTSKQLKKCPFCAEEIKTEAKICPHCNKNIEEYELELKNKEEENRRKKEQEMKEKYKNIEDLFKDEKIMEEAKELRRVYGKSMYISHLKSKAKELGLGEIDLSENDIE